MNIIVAAIKTWNIENAMKLKEYYADKHNVYIITNKQELNYENISKINPDYIFFPHWSWKINSEIYDIFNCVVFHMSDLPFGRGGSPLQNLIDRELEETKISAIKVDDGIDTGDVYLKEKLNLNGTADEILIRASDIIFNKMITYIIENNVIPKKQIGKVVEFKRRNPKESEIKEDFSLKKIYDYIRMLDGEGYPKAFIKLGNYKLEFSRASFKNGKIIADVEISNGGENNE